MAQASDHTTGNDPAEGMDPGGDPFHQARKPRTKPAQPSRRPSAKTRMSVSGDQNDRRPSALVKAGTPQPRQNRFSSRIGKFRIRRPVA